MTRVAAPDRLHTARLLLRRPTREDAPALFVRYAGDPEVTRYVGWPTHRSVDDTHTFLAFSDAEWARWPAGPYLACAADSGAILGSTGLAFETATRAATGYVFARDAWGQGFATEVLAAMVDLAPAVGVRRLYAICHVDHRASAHVLDKCAFEREGVLRRYVEFPNLAPGELADVLCFARVF